MSGMMFLRKIGQAVDRHYLKKAGAMGIPGSNEQLLLFCFHPYAGKERIRLEDGTVIEPGEPVAELHLSNIRVTQIAAEPSERTMEWRLLGLLKAEFTILAEACVDGKISDQVKAFYGVNVLVAGARRLGFTLVPIPKGWNRLWLGFWESLLRLVYYSFKTKKKAALQRTMDPFEVWISRPELIRRYYKG
jgi:hypothetical protein